MPDRKYAETHEWVTVEGEIATVGISDYAVEQLGDVVFLDLAAPGKALNKGEVIGDVESVKAVSQIYAPVSGEIVEVNGALEGAPEMVNSSPLENGWIVKLRVSAPEELEGLMDQQAYTEHVSEHP